MTIEDHFNFTQTPFSREFAITSRISLPFIDEQVDKLRAVIEARSSALLMAPAGTGKTVILRTIKSLLAETRYNVTYIKVTGLSQRDLCREISAAMGLPIASLYPALVRNIQQHLSQIHSDHHQRPVILIDEAHDMRPEGLSMLRLLTNFEMDSKLVVSLIIAGQPLLKEKLFKTSLEDIRQRMSHCGELRLLSRKETADYLKARVSMAGRRSFCFDSPATQALYEFSRGNMRAIDALAYKALQLAANDKDQMVGQQHVEQARNDLWI